MTTRSETNNFWSRLMKSSSLYAIGGILRNLVGFAMLPVYTRYLTPSDYGIVALMVFAISLFEIVLGAKMVQAPQKYYHDESNEAKKKQVISTTLLISGGMSSLIAIFAIMLSDKLALFLFDDPDLAVVATLFLLLLPTQAIETVCLTYLRIKNQAQLYLKLSLLKLALQLSANIFFIVVLDLGVLGMATATSGSAILFAGIVLLLTIKDIGLSFNTSISKKLIIFSMPLWLSGFISLYVGSSNRYFMTEFGTLEDVGLYSLAERLSAILATLVFTPFMAYWSAERFRIKDTQDFKQQHKNVFIALYTCLLILGLGLSIFSDLIIQLLTTPSFYSAYTAVPILVSAAIFNCLAEMYQFSLFHKEKTQLMWRIISFSALSVTVLNFLLVPKWGFVGAALAFAGASFTTLLTSFYYSNQVFKTDFPLLRFVFWLCVSAAGYILSTFISANTEGFINFICLCFIFLATSLVLLFGNLNKTQLIWCKTVINQKLAQTK